MKTNELFPLFSSVLLLFLTSNVLSAQAQTAPIKDTSDSQQIAINLLQYPSSPALSVLGLEATQVPNPDENHDIGLSIRNATNNFTTLPNTFALDIAPAWAFPQKKPVFVEYSVKTDSSKGSPGASSASPQAQPLQRHRVWIDSKISFAYTNADNHTRLGVGFRVPLMKGKIVSDYADALKYVDEFFNQHRYKAGDTAEIQRLRAERKKALNAHPEDRKALNAKYDSLIQHLEKDSQTVYLQTLSPQIDSVFKAAYQYLKFYSVGFNLDFGTGLSVEFPTLSFSYTRVPIWSAWLSGSYFFNDNLSVLGVGRYAVLPEEMYTDPSDNTKMKVANDQHIDVGFKIQYFNHSTLSASFEYLKRLTPNNVDIQPTDRYTVNINYALAKTNLLTFSVGKDFDNQLLKDGNVVALLHFLFGFGNQRPVKVKSN